MWLEDVTGDKALDWVRARNKLAQEKLEVRSGLCQVERGPAGDPRLGRPDPVGLQAAATTTTTSGATRRTRAGLWRRTTLAEYEKAEPQWDVILDLDALGAKENENWVWGGARLLRPTTPAR